MVKKVEIYETFDGSQLESIKEAIKHEEDAINTIRETLAYNIQLEYPNVDEGIAHGIVYMLSNNLELLGEWHSAHNSIMSTSTEE